jgi:hypothetical protein
MADTRTDLLVKMAARAHDAIALAVRQSGDYAAQPGGESLLIARNELAAALAEWSMLVCGGCSRTFPDTDVLKVRVIEQTLVDVKQHRLCISCVRAAAQRGELAVTPLRKGP